MKGYQPMKKMHDLNNDRIINSIKKKLIAAGKTISVAESVSGGLLQVAFTQT